MAVVELGMQELVDNCQLGVSELVTNALLHGRSEVQVVIRGTSRGVRVEVTDTSAATPVPKDYGTLAPTGRGLQLVVEIADDVGVDHHGAAGKTVWFELDQTPRPRRSDVADWAAAHQPTEAGHEVVLIGVPVELWAAAQPHHDAMLRELLLSSLEFGVASSLDLGDDLAEAEQAQALLAKAFEAALNASPEDGAASDVDVHLSVAPGQLARFFTLQDVLDEAEKRAAKGELLVLPALPEIVALRDWCCEQVQAQVQGVEPSGWRGSHRDVSAGASSGRFAVPTPVWDDALVRESAEYLVAADDHNRILSVSQGAAALLGWPVDELVGRRIVTLVPPRLREAHIAGFTRHLTTGESRVLGVDIQLPVLHADGHELVCGFRIDRIPVGAGRSVYLARLTPPPA